MPFCGHNFLDPSKMLQMLISKASLPFVEVVLDSFWTAHCFFGTQYSLWTSTKAQWTKCLDECLREQM